MGVLKRLRTYFKDSIIKQYDYFYYYYDIIKELYISSVKWENLPPEIDQRFLELILYEKGAVVFYKDEILNEFVCLPFASEGKRDIYNTPFRRRAYANNSYNYTVDRNNSVIIWNNYLRMPSIRTGEIYAKKFSNLENTIDVNVHAQKTPVFIRCDEKERLSVLNLFKCFTGNEPVVFGDKNLSATPLEVLKTDAPYVADKLYDLKSKYWSEILTFIGIPNISLQKKERMVKDEASKMIAGTLALSETRIGMRQQAVDKINSMFGLDIKVSMKLDELEKIEEIENTEEREVVEDE